MDPETQDKLLAKVKWAKKHLHNLEVFCAEFVKSNPYRIERQHDAQAREFVYYVRHIQPVPIDAVLIAGDVLANLRSALDNVAVHFYGGPNRRPYFPIFGSSAKYHLPETTADIQYFGQHFKSVLDSIKPYKGGNSALWQLNELNNLNKHRLLLTAVSANYARSETPSERKQARDDWARNQPNTPFPLPESASRFVHSANPTKALKAGDEVFRVPDTEINEKPTLLIDVAIDEAGIAQGDLLVPLLLDLSNVVLRVVLDICN